MRKAAIQMLIVAVLLVLLYACLRLGGWASFTTFLSGTAAPGMTVAQTSMRGGVYLLVHLMAWGLAPILLIAAALAWVWGRGEKRPEPIA